MCVHVVVVAVDGPWLLIYGSILMGGRESVALLLSSSVVERVLLRNVLRSTSLIL